MREYEQYTGCRWTGSDRLFDALLAAATGILSWQATRQATHHFTRRVIS